MIITEPNAETLLLTICSPFNKYGISKIKTYLAEDQLKSVIQAFVISKIDQTNSLLSDCPKTLTSTMKSVQNAAAKLIFGIWKFDHVTPYTQKTPLASSGKKDTI